MSIPALPWTALSNSLTTILYVVWEFSQGRSSLSSILGPVYSANGQFLSLHDRIEPFQKQADLFFHGLYKSHGNYMAKVEHGWINKLCQWLKTLPVVSN